jgi:amidase
MKVDLYLNKYASDEITIRSISEIIAYNNNDSLRIPYGQGRFKEMLSENSSKVLQLKARIKKKV